MNRSKPNNNSKTKGFSLLEVLIAVALTAIAGVIAYGFLNSAMSAYTGHSEKAQRLNEINLFFSMLSRDITHAMDRPIRDEYGEKEAAMIGGINAEYLLSLTRGGYPNPRELPRSELQRIAYGLNDTRLERIVWPMLDRVSSDNVLKTTALSGVDNVAVRFLKKENVIVDDDEIANDWQENWPQEQSAAALAEMPAAIEITLELQGWGEVRRLYALGGEA